MPFSFSNISDHVILAMVMVLTLAQLISYVAGRLNHSKK